MIISGSAYSSLIQEKVVSTHPCIHENKPQVRPTDYKSPCYPNGEKPTRIEYVIDFGMLAIHAHITVYRG